MEHALPHPARARSDEERAYYRLSRRVYSVFAPFYDWVTVPLRAFRELVVDAALPSPDARVLDVATGTGAQAAAFARRCKDVVGLDLSPAMLRVAARKHDRANLRFIEGDATALPFADASFDVTCISFALHEMPRTIRGDALRELARVTKVDGRVVIADYGLPSDATLRWIVFHGVKLYEGDVYADFVHSDVGAMLARAGLEVLVEQTGLHGAARVIVAAKRAAH